MKETRKLAGIPMLLLTVISLLYPVAVIAFGADGYSISLNYPSVTMAIITVITLVLSLMAISAKAGWFSTLLAMLLPAFTAVNCLFFAIQFPSVLTLVLAAVCMLSAIVAAISCRQGVVSCILIILLALLPTALAGYLGYQSITDPSEFTPTSETVLELPSPEGGYTATVKRSATADSGSDCGITLTFNDAPVSFGIGRLERQMNLVHMMAWEDFDASDLQWIDEHTLLCNGNTYAITADGAELIGSAEASAEAFAESILAATEELVEATAALVEEAAAAQATEAPAIEVEAPAAEAEAPVAETEAPAVEAEAPVAESETPAVEPDLPVVQIKGPAVEAEAPAQDAELAGAVVADPAA